MFDPCGLMHRTFALASLSQGVRIRVFHLPRRRHIARSSGRPGAHKGRSSSREGQGCDGPFKAKDRDWLPGPFGGRATCVSCRSVAINQIYLALITICDNLPGVIDSLLIDLLSHSWINKAQR
jgi:hypothetical protein